MSVCPVTALDIAMFATEKVTFITAWLALVATVAKAAPSVTGPDKNTITKKGLDTNVGLFYCNKKRLSFYRVLNFLTINMAYLNNDSKQYKNYDCCYQKKRGKNNSKF